MKPRKMVLIADDEDFIRKLSSKILTREGFITLLAENGEKAIEIYKQQGTNIELVILDIRMPGLSGIDVLKYIASHNPEARVVFCSGYGEEDLPANHGDCFIQKPFSIDIFKESVRRVLTMSIEEIKKSNERILNFNFPKEVLEGHFSEENMPF